MSKIFEWFYSKLAGFFVDVLTKFGIKAAKNWAAAMTLMVALVTAFVAFQQVIQGLVVVLIHAPSDTWFQTAAWLVLPSNFPSCVSAIVTARIAKFGYMWFSWKTRQFIHGYQLGQKF